MYQAPDFIVVKVDVEENFAAYPTGCPMDEMHTVPCASDANYKTFIGLGWGDGCYSTYNP